MYSDGRRRGRRLAPDGGQVTDVAGDERADEQVILVADDDVDLAVTIKLWLQEEYTIEMAHDGSEALEVYGPHVDVILLDRRMPTMSGDETLEQFRERGVTAPIAMMTAVDPEWDVAELDLDTYLRKPVRRENVVDAVDGLVQRAAFPEDDLRRAFAIGSKLRVLQRNYTAEELFENEQTRQLGLEFQEIHDRTDAGRDTLDDEMRAEFDRLRAIVDEICDG
ncbi:response regulator transcription factor [Haloarchaeobius sp. TZWWS8]|uniref:response regulator transcription factor n=1 Tax=Haloarchaeobius sp. TZWWS8 TaxID=3446121 RepID=UPI003EBD2C76